jgi:hypothetical protein
MTANGTTYLPFFTQRPIAVREEMVFSDPKARDDLPTAGERCAFRL